MTKLEEKEQETQDVFLQVIPLSPAIQQPHHRWEFYKKDTAADYTDSRLPQRQPKSLATENVYGILDTYSTNILTHTSISCLWKTGL